MLRLARPAALRPAAEAAQSSFRALGGSTRAFSTEEAETSSSGDADASKGPHSAAALALLTGDRSKYPRFFPRIKRAELGSYGDQQAQDAFLEESEGYLRIPSDKPLYNLRDVVPEMALPQSAELDRLRAARRAAGPSAGIADVLRQAGFVGEETARELGRELSAPPAADDRQILRWESKVILAAGVDETHPANWKAKVSVYLRDLQREAGLSEDGIRRIAAVAGPRYCDATGILTLVGDRYPSAGENQRDLRRTLAELVEEGRKFGGQALQQ